METVSAVLMGATLLIALFTSWYLLAPFFETAKAALQADDTVASNTTEERELRELEDLEHDFLAGKMDRETHDTQKAQLLQSLVSATKHKRDEGA